MPASLVWSPEAREDLLELYVTIAVEHPAAADRYLDRLQAKAALLSERPRMGMRRPDIRPSTRILIEVPFVILYETLPDSDEEDIDTVEIVRIVDGRRDLQNLF